MRSPLPLLLVAAVLGGGLSPVAAYEATAVADGGTIRGRVVHRGPVPVRRVVPMKNREVCGGPRDVPLIRVGPAGGVAQAVVFLKGVARGKPWPAPVATPELSNRDCVFEPHVQVVPAGRRLAVLNEDPVLHNTHAFLDRRTVFNIALPNRGQRIEKPLRGTGLVRVECDSHSWMLAWIWVADSPYYALTGADGAFALGGVPPGRHTLVLWQEHAGAREIPVTVGAGATVDLTLELEPR